MYGESNATLKQQNELLIAKVNKVEDELQHVKSRLTSVSSVLGKRKREEEEEEKASGEEKKRRFNFPLDFCFNFSSFH